VPGKPSFPNAHPCAALGRGWFGDYEFNPSAGHGFGGTDVGGCGFAGRARLYWKGDVIPAMRNFRKSPTLLP
jgi:hypothetical protein